MVRQSELFLLFSLAFYITYSQAFPPIIADTLQTIGPAYVIPNRTYDWLCLSRDVPCDNASLMLVAPDGSLLASKNVPPAENNILLDAEKTRNGCHEMNLSWSHQFPLGNDPFTISCVVQCFDGRWREKVSFTIQVHKPPFVFVPATNTTVTELDLVTLEIKVNSSLPLTNVLWSKDGELLDVSDGTHFVGGTTSVPSLTVIRTRWKDTGNYTASVKNDVGVFNATLIYVNVLYAPIVTIDSPTLRVPLETTVTLTCGVKANPEVTNITWYVRHSNDSFESSLPARSIFQEVDVHSTVLTLSRVTKDHSGIYIATAKNSIGVGRSQGVTVVVDSTLLVAPVVTFVRPLLPGTEGRVMCTFNTSLATGSSLFPIRWVVPSAMETRTMNESNVSKRDGHPTYIYLSTLSVFPVQVSDDQLPLTCQVRIGEAWSSVTVSFYLDEIAPPKVTVPPAIPPVIQGRLVVIPCHVTSRTTPIVVTWYKDGQLIGWGQRDYHGGDVAVPVLNIPEGIEPDSGEYVCSATNIMGQGNSSAVSVYVYTVPTATIPKAHEPIFSLLDDDVTIPCSYTATRPTRLLWYQDDILVNIPSERSEGGTLSTPSLTIKGTQANDSGEFMCEVQTLLATGRSQRVFLRIDKTSLPAPKVVPLGLFERGQHVVVVSVCTYRSALPIQPLNQDLPLTWISRNPNLISVIEQYNSALNLKQFNKQDIGTTFVCTVHLEGATSSVEWTLSVNDLSVASEA